MRKVKFSVGTCYVGSQVEEEFTFEELSIEDLEGEELDEALDEIYTDWVWQNIDGGYEVEED